MSLPQFSTQAELFSTAGLSSTLFASTDRYRIFARLVYPILAKARDELEECYCLDNGRVAIEPVLMLGVSILQYIDNKIFQGPEYAHIPCGFELAPGVEFRPETNGVRDD